MEEKAAVVTELRQIKALLAEFLIEIRANRDAVSTESPPVVVQPNCEEDLVAAPPRASLNSKEALLASNNAFFVQFAVADIGKAQALLDKATDVEVATWPLIGTFQLFFAEPSFFIKCCRRGLIDLEAAGGFVRYFCWHKGTTQADYDWFAPQVTPQIAENLRQVRLSGDTNLVNFACQATSNTQMMQFLWDLKEAKSGVPVFSKDQYWTKEQFKAGESQNFMYIKWWVDHVFAD